MAEAVMTVLGPVDPERIGVTLTHEHLFMDAASASIAKPAPTDEGGHDRPWNCATAAEARWNPLSYPENLRFTDMEMILEELAPFSQLGGSAIVDVTPAVLGRNPQALVEISRQTGVHVVMGGGYYTSPFHTPEVNDLSIDELAQRFVKEALEGVDGTGVRCGIMGEVGTGDPPTDAEVKLLRAHASAFSETGVPITIHQESWALHGHQVLDVLRTEGVPENRVVLGHMTPLIAEDRYQRSLLDRGAYLSYDFLGMDHSIFAYGKDPPDPPGRYPPPDYDVLVKVAELVNAGYARQILLSGDTGELIRMRRFGGWGFAHILEHVVPLMRALGLDDEVIDIILIDNPRALLAHAVDRVA
jgi:phosphotriesterase-related protein